MIGLAHSSFRAIAPDYRGHELSDPPSQPDKASYRDLISGVFGIIDSLAIPKVFLVGKEFWWSANVLICPCVPR
ncbi:hypothetical protein ACFX13_037577 [Malus domestica]